MSNKMYNAFGCLWMFNLTAHQAFIPRCILLPTISVLCQNIETDKANIRYWNIDFMWLRGVLTFEIEQLKLNDDCIN